MGKGYEASRHEGSSSSSHEGHEGDEEEESHEGHGCHEGHAGDEEEESHEGHGGHGGHEGNEGHEMNMLPTISSAPCHEGLGDHGHEGHKVSYQRYCRRISTCTQLLFCTIDERCTIYK